MGELLNPSVTNAARAPAGGQQPRVCLVTGASAGIGKAASVELARRGMRVVMLCRDAERGERARRDVAAAAQQAPELVIADLASLDAVRQGAAEIARRWPAIHVLINNAGVSLARRAVSADGYEMT
jgi:NAD(P)-dependent dehydrogenase (short-subunit alcohol dehydrogenase family)